jgi:NarL family two-component system response regulator LiaR
MRNPIRVLVVDDHAVVRRGIRALLATEADVQVVGDATDGREAIALAECLRPDVILMDLVMPGLDGIEAIRRIAPRYPDTRILVLTSFATDDKVFPAVKAGALGYLLKDSSPEELVGAIYQVHSGQPSLHPTIAQKALQELSPPSEPAQAPQPLTERELEVLHLVARGRGNQEIAKELTTSEATIRRHVHDILQKLHAATRTQAVLYALREGLASLDSLAPAYGRQLLALLGKTPQSAPYGGRGDTTDGARTPAKSSPARELEALRLVAADHKKVGQELAMAGEIQASFLPDVLPRVPGWQLSVTLEPARETAGDFYDVIPLPNGHLAILVADVTDKGMGAALYMALSRTLIRTYAVEYDARPDLLFKAVNERILLDTRASLFVTVFYGILDPVGGTLTYSNAGHNPPYLLSARDRNRVEELGRTGMPLGVLEDATWQQGVVEIEPRDLLVVYSDGITEAQDRHETCFGRGRLLGIAQASLGRSARDIRDVLIAEVHEFAGDVPQFDDITLMVVVRDSSQRTPPAQ